MVAWVATVGVAVLVVDATATVFGQMTAGGIPHDKIKQVFAGELPTALLLTGPGGTINPAAPAIQHVPFLVWKITNNNLARTSFLEELEPRGEMAALIAAE